MGVEFEINSRLSFYARVSTGKEDQANSLENQKSFFERVYASNEKYITSDEWLYFDKGITGTKLKRPDFDRMLYDAGLDIVEVRNNDNDTRKEFLEYVTIPSSKRKPKFDIIIIKTTSRFARNINAYKILEQLRKKKVYVYFWDKGKYTKNDSDLADIQRYLLADEEESRTKSRIVAFGMKESAEKGIIRTGGNPIGYKYIKEENRLEIVEEEAEMVRKIFQWYLEGNGIKRIIRKLTENNYHNRKGKEFTINTIKRLLQNERYIGWSVRNKLDIGNVFERNSYAKVKDESEWIIKKDTGKIPAIISEEVFFKVKEMMNNQVNHKINKGIYRGVSEFASKIYCGKCGKVYHKNVDKGRHYYNCSSKRKYGVEKCNNPNLYLTKINELITPEKYREDLYNENVQFELEISTLAHKLMNSISNADKQEVDKFKIEQEELQERRHRILNMYELNYINEDELHQKIDPINKELKEIESKIYQFSKNNDEIIKDLDELYDNTMEIVEEYNLLAKQSKSEFAKEHPREKIVADIKKMIVNEDGTVKIYYKTFDKYYTIRDKYKHLLSIYVKDNDIEKLLEKMRQKKETPKENLWGDINILKVM